MKKGKIFIQGIKENEWIELKIWEKIIWEHYLNNFTTEDGWNIINVEDKIYYVNGSKYTFLFENKNFILLDLNRNIKRILIELPYHSGLN